MSQPMRLLVPVGAMLACLVSILPRTAGASERVFVLSQTGAALSELDADAETIAATVTLDKAPAAVALSHDAKLAYVTHPDISQVSVVDLDRRQVTRKLKVTGSPFGIAALRDGRLFVADWNGAHVTLLDREGVPAREIAVGRAPAHLILTPDEKLLFVANRESDSVSVVRIADFTVRATIPVGHAPFAMALAPDAKTLYVGNVQAGTLSVIDVATAQVTATLRSGAMPYGAAVTPDQSHVLVSNQQASTISVLSTNSVAAPPIKVGGYPEAVAVSADGKRAFVANWFSDDTSVIDIKTLQQIRRIKCPAGPRGIVIAPDTR